MSTSHKVSTNGVRRGEAEQVRWLEGGSALSLSKVFSLFRFILKIFSCKCSPGTQLLHCDWWNVRKIKKRTARLHLQKSWNLMPNKIEMFNWWMTRQLQVYLPSIRVKVNVANWLFHPVPTHQNALSILFLTVRIAHQHVKGFTVCMTSTKLASVGSSRTKPGIPWNSSSAGSRPDILIKTLKERTLDSY